MAFINLTRKVLNPMVAIRIVNCLEARYGEKKPCLQYFLTKVNFNY